MQRELDALRLGEPLPPTRPVARPEPKPEPPKTEVPSFDTPVSSTGPTRLFPDTEMPEYDWRALSDKAYKMENPPANAPFNYEYKNPEAKKLKAQADEMEDKYFADKQAFEREVFDTPVPIKYSRYAREGDNYDGLVDGSDLQKARDKYVVDDENTLSLNESLRNGGKPTALVKRIDKWIDSTSIREPITVQRGIVIDRQFALDNYTVGSELTSPAFTSTSVLPGSRGGANARGYLEGRTKDLDFESEAKRLGMTREEYLSSPERSARDKYFEELLGKSGDRPLDNGVIFEIRLETGQKAGWAGQGEVVLPRGTTLRVDSVTEGGPYDPLSVKATVVKKAEKPVAQRVPAQGNSPSVSTEAPIDVLSRAATEVVSGETETAYKQLLDTLFEDTLAHKGMTALPKVVSKSEWDSLPGDSFFRGIKAGGRLSQSELDRAVNDFYEGDCFTGDGILGKGIYATPDLETAQSYAYGLRARPQDLLDPSAHVFDMKFSADTKFIDMAEARALQEQERKAIADNAYRRVAKIVEDKQSGKITAEQYSAASRTERYRAEAELALNQQSLSSWAMSHDYDVLTDYQYPQMVVLNRGKVITHR